MHVDLTDTTILLTGAGGRLGRVLAEHLLDYGATVACADVGQMSGGNARQRIYQADLTEEPAVERLVADVVDEQGPIDALIHTVGMWAGAPLAQTRLADFEEVMRVNLTSTFLCFREVARHAAEHGREARLVAFASRQGVAGGVAEQGAYSAAKAGVVRLIESTAREFDGRGITATGIAPSMILYGDEAPGTEGVGVDELCRLCAYLASPAGASHNGGVLPAYGTLIS